MRVATCIVLALGSGALALPQAASRRSIDQGLAGNRENALNPARADKAVSLPRCSPKVTATGGKPKPEPTSTQVATPVEATSDTPTQETTLVAETTPETTSTSDPKPPTTDAAKPENPQVSGGLMPWVVRPSKDVLERNECPVGVFNPVHLTDEKLQVPEEIIAKCGTGVYCRNLTPYVGDKWFKSQAACFAAFEPPPNHPRTKLPWKESISNEGNLPVNSPDVCDSDTGFRPDDYCGTRHHCNSYTNTHEHDDMYRNIEDCIASHDPEPEEKL
ncbi:S-adenosylmethionine decarboxylase [Purpureocillium lavendulum]|uniref:S-adenosylmethionine decarboxylase n=1 Tax=Purpureocillium lavendulum TaxID=1247861 RepID=A0AB34FLD8_9HYPO|nr:S-adenosylmethionine decarboxylase [Purpureocillium lavendulum]